MTHQVLYLTGAPASGKSTLATALKAQGLASWDYGAELLKRVAAARGRTYAELRGDSAAMITAEDVAKTDGDLVGWVAEERQRRHVVIDTHAVTREPFGFRVTPFSTERIVSLAPTALLCLYLDPEVARHRIASKPEGRLGVSTFEAGLHAGMQASVVVAYSIAVGVPAYMVDASGSPESLVKWVSEKFLSKTPRSTPGT
jgi:adenylate kinase